jgi:hypothetical protein
MIGARCLSLSVIRWWSLISFRGSDESGDDDGGACDEILCDDGEDEQPDHRMNRLASCSWCWIE